MYKIGEEEMLINWQIIERDLGEEAKQTWWEWKVIEAWFIWNCFVICLDFVLVLDYHQKVAKLDKD